LITDVAALSSDAAATFLAGVNRGSPVATNRRPPERASKPAAKRDDVRWPGRDQRPELADDEYDALCREYARSIASEIVRTHGLKHQADRRVLAVLNEYRAAATKILELVNARHPSIQNLYRDEKRRRRELAGEWDAAAAEVVVEVPGPIDRDMAAMMAAGAGGGTRNVPREIVALALRQLGWKNVAIAAAIKCAESSVERIFRRYR
jgi:hypothetical protein